MNWAQWTTRMTATLLRAGALALAAAVASAQAQVQELPLEALKQTRPSDRPAELRLPSARAGLETAINHDDLRGLYNAHGFTACETSSPGPSMFSRNFSNFGGDCYAKQRAAFHVKFDKHYRDRTTKYLTPKHAWDNPRFADIAKASQQRFITRNLQKFARGNAALSAIVEGKIAFDFTLDGMVNALTSEEVQAEQDQRPRYELRLVRELPNEHDGRVAGLGATTGAAIAGVAVADPEDPFALHRREIVEVWPLPEIKTPIVPAPKVEGGGWGKRIARNAGLDVVPFTKFGVRMERRTTPTSENVFLRLGEASNLVYAELPEVLSGNVSTVAWGYRVPFHRNSLNVRYNTLNERAVTSYIYHINDRNRGEVSYNANTRAYAAAFVKDL